MKKLLALVVALCVYSIQFATAAGSGLTPDDRKKFSDMGVYVVGESVTVIVPKDGFWKRLGCVKTSETKSVILLDVTPSLFGPHKVIFVRCSKGNFNVYVPQKMRPTQT